jgi:hypothetical protein
MVHNIVSKASLPFRGQVLQHRGKHLKGSGMGSVLLNTGGAGSASSYIDIDDYIHTTGRNPFSTKGKGLGDLSKKLQKLNVQPEANIRRKNIIM